MNALDIAIYIEDLTKSATAKQFSIRTKFPIVNNFCHKYTLVFMAQRIELRLLDAKIKPILVDFLEPEFFNRLQRSNHRNELLARAVGIKPPYYPSVIDATAGFGADGMLLSKLGCDLIMIERSPILGLLLQDGIDRAHQKFPALFQHKIVHCCDAKEFITKLHAKHEQVDVVYLDPMFPQRTKSALVRKEMRILKELVGEDQDANELFSLARIVARKRVVVKRSLNAPFLSDVEPSAIFKAKACRFDVYIQ